MESSNSSVSNTELSINDASNTNGDEIGECDEKVFVKMETNDSDDSTKPTSNHRENRLTSIIDQLRCQSKFRGNSQRDNFSFTPNNGEAGGGARRCARDAAASPAQASAHAHAPAQAPPAHPQSLIKSERLSPHESTASRSRSVTPSTSSYPGTPPERGSPHAPPPPGQTHPPRNYSDIMRSLAARYNTQTEPSRLGLNGYGIDRTSAQIDDPVIGGIFSRFANFNGMSRTPAIPPSLDMSATKEMYAMARATRRQTSRRKRSRMNINTSVEPSPLDLSAGGESSAKRARLNSSPSTKSDTDERVSSDSQGEARNVCLCAEARARLAAWSVDEVCDFIATIDLCDEYVTNFREQRIDGAGLTLLTEDHLTGVLKMRLGPALKFKAALAIKLALCAYCQAGTSRPHLNGSVNSEPRSNPRSPS